MAGPLFVSLAFRAFGSVDCGVGEGLFHFENVDSRRWIENGARPSPRRQHIVAGEIAPVHVQMLALGVEGYGDEASFAVRCHRICDVEHQHSFAGAELVNRAELPGDERPSAIGMPRDVNRLRGCCFVGETYPGHEMWIAGWGRRLVRGRIRQRCSGRIHTRLENRCRSRRRRKSECRLVVDTTGHGENAGDDHPRDGEKPRSPSARRGRYTVRHGGQRNLLMR